MFKQESVRLGEIHGEQQCVSEPRRERARQRYSIHRDRKRTV